MVELSQVSVAFYRSLRTLKHREGVAWKEALEHRGATTFTYDWFALRLRDLS